jgi:Na+-driven multidrug efflux pump
MGSNFFISGIGTIFDEARDNLLVLALCIPLHAMNAVLVTFIEANGHAKLVSKLQIGQTLCMFILVAIILSTGQPSLFNIIFLYVLIDIIYFIILMWLMYKKELFHLKYYQFVHIKELMKPLSVSTPSVASQLISQYAIFVLTATIATFGAASAAALSTIFGFVMLSQVMVLGVCQQMTMTVAQQQKAQQPIWPTIKVTGYALLLITIIVVAILLLAPRVVGQLITNDQKVLPIFMQSLNITLLLCLTVFLSVFLSCLLRALGDYLVPQIIVAIPTVCFIIYTIFIKHALSFSTIFYAYLICLCMAVMGLIIRLIYFYRKNDLKPDHIF